VLSYLRLNNASLIQLQSCLLEGFPFVFGFTVYESFMSIGKNGMMPMPTTMEQRLGGHAVMAVGYDDAKKFLLYVILGAKLGATKDIFICLMLISLILIERMIFGQFG